MLCVTIACDDLSQMLAKHRELVHQGARLVEGSSEKVPLLAFLAKKALLEYLWEKYQLFWKEFLKTIPIESQYRYHSLLQSTVQDVLWEELKPREKEIKEETPLKKGWFRKTQCESGSKGKELNSEEQTSMKLHSAISELETYLNTIQKPPKCCMSYGHLAFAWHPQEK